MTRIVLFLLLFGVIGSVFPQNKKQKELENRKKALLEQIKEMSALRTKQAQERKSVITQIQEINEKINARTELIKLIHQQANFLNSQIQENTKNIASLEKELSTLKKEYADVIRQSYKNRTGRSQVLFLLSSENFWQGYKRLKYIQQYSAHRKKKSEEIQLKNKKLQQINDTLLTQQQQKAQVLQENRHEQEVLATEKKQQEALVASIKKKESQYEAEIRKKQAQANQIDKEIDRLIRLAIAEANAKAKKLAREKAAKDKATGEKASSATSASTSEKDEANVFALTPEGKTISTNFEANKGKLIWPVSRGYKSQGFGTYADPVYPQVQHNNSGISIVTQKGEDARSVFDGEVSAIIAVPGGNKAVQIRHGNFITIYYNLTEVYVSKGQQVQAKTPLGKIFTDGEGKTEMKFFVYKNTTKLNPEHWIQRM
ncbi:MAG: peptidoglycan DD-metalloendopeptidase family protein [Capnocytophaga sp.]|nr:peptidoglycan DD-metalloendopeptidase family protein [Capnocytophaga sp.]